MNKHNYSEEIYKVVSWNPRSEPFQIMTAAILNLTNMAVEVHNQYF